MLCRDGQAGRKNQGVLAGGQVPAEGGARTRRRNVQIPCRKKLEIGLPKRIA